MENKIWLFEQVPHGGSLYIYGAGAFGTYVLEGLQKRGYTVTGFIDSFKTGAHQGFPVLKLDDFLHCRPHDAVIAVASMYAAEIVQTLIKDRKSTRLNSSHCVTSRMPSSA